MDLQADLAEPVAELLSRVAPNGVAMEMLQGSVRIRAWLPDDGALRDRRRQLDEGLWHLSQIQPFPTPGFKLVEEEPWEVVWKDNYQPLEIGERIQILPSWMDHEDSTRFPIYLEPGMAFGTGAHTTTRHCLEALELLVREGDKVGDLGCGSGILAIAAAHLGAGEVVGIDVDQQAVMLAQENVQRNGVSDRVQIMRGSLAELEGLSPFQLIVANIRASVLEEFMQAGISRHITANGRVVMSGILEEQIDSLLEQGENYDLIAERTMETGDWRSIVFAK